MDFSFVKFQLDHQEDFYLSKLIWFETLWCCHSWHLCRCCRDNLRTSTWWSTPKHQTLGNTESKNGSKSKNGSDKTYLWMTMTHMCNTIEAVKIFVTFFVKNILFWRFGNFHILEPFSCRFIPVKRQIFPIVTRWTRRHGLQFSILRSS